MAFFSKVNYMGAILRSREVPKWKTKALAIRSRYIDESWVSPVALNWFTCIREFTFLLPIVLEYTPLVSYRWMNFRLSYRYATFTVSHPRPTGLDPKGLCLYSLFLPSRPIFGLVPKISQYARFPRRNHRGWTRNDPPFLRKSPLEGWRVALASYLRWLLLWSGALPANGAHRLPYFWI